MWWLAEWENPCPTPGSEPHRSRCMRSGAPPTRVCPTPPHHTRPVCGATKGVYVCVSGNSWVRMCMCCVCATLGVCVSVAMQVVHGSLVLPDIPPVRAETSETVCREAGWQRCGLVFFVLFSPCSFLLGTMTQSDCVFGLAAE